MSTGRPTLLDTIEEKEMKKFFTSKKAWAMIIGVIGVISAAATGVQEWGPAILQAVGMIGAYIVAQGVADHGKEAEDGSRY